MPKINWQDYDLFQVLARRANPSLTQIREHRFDVYLYGVYLEGRCIFIGKVDEPASGLEDEKIHRVTQLCARVDAEGFWKVVTDKQLESIFLPQAVPLNLLMQWVPDEVKLVFDAILLARPRQEKMPRSQNTKKT